jgi:hypothetical protein
LVLHIPSSTKYPFSQKTFFASFPYASERHGLTGDSTIEISDELCRQLKRKAADEGVTIRQVVESALRVYLGKQPRRKGYALKWGTERGRILPGVRLDDRDALFDLMDGRR